MTTNAIHTRTILGLALAGGCTAGDEGRPGQPWQGLDGQSDESGGDDEPTPDELPTAPIYGGNTVPACGWPTTVELGGACTGTLVHPQVVIYAAHCGTGYTSVRFGESINGGGGRTVATSFCHTYPGGAPGTGQDFAVCKLAQAQNDVPIVPIAMGCETDEIAAGKQVTLVGFGEADNGPYGIKRQVVTSINGISSADEVDIGGGGKDTCQGDSGGPVFMQLDDGTWRVFGITSYGGACGTGGMYSQMHHGISWFESETGLDITPCHDADGTWNPSASCTGFPLTPGSTHGTWANGCSGGALSGASTTCGDADAPDPDPMPEPEPEPACTGCVDYVGSLSGAGDQDVQPDGSYYQAAAGAHHGALDGPTGKDFDLYLLKWGNNRWNQVAASTSSSPDELIDYNGSAGYYAWVVKSYSGSGSYTLTLSHP